MELKLSFTEENYLKAIYHLSEGGVASVSTNALSDFMETKPASVSDMIKKLAQKEVVSYEKYRGVNISEKGRTKALQIIRKHRLWEVFLVDKLNFQWDEVHEVAEELEHINSPLLIKRLDAYLDYPRVDPHGDPIPEEDGTIKQVKQVPLAEVQDHNIYRVASVNDSNNQFLQYLNKIGIYINAKVKVIDKIEFDGSLEIAVDNGPSIYISQQASNNILVTTK